jgi:ABC-type uncharacterized transport system substrate-binding protein
MKADSFLDRITCRRAASALMGAAFLLTPSTALSHPHEWIEMKVEVLFGESGQVTGFRHDWLMDEFFSAYAVADLPERNGMPTARGLELLAEGMLGNISEIDYFMRLAQEGATPKPGAYTDEDLTFENGQLRMTFETAVNGALPVQEAPLTYKIYDPEFYIEMIHIEGNEPVSLTDAAAACGWELNPPEENQALAAFASTLGPDQSPGMELGSFFAEEVTIKC